MADEEVLKALRVLHQYDRLNEFYSFSYKLQDATQVFTLFLPEISSIRLEKREKAHHERGDGEYQVYLWTSGGGVYVCYLNEKEAKALVEQWQHIKLLYANR